MELSYHYINFNKGDFDMDQNIRASLQISTFYNFQIVVVLTTMAQVATMLTIVFGDISGKEHMVAASVVVPTLLGAFGIIRIMTNLKFIVDEMDDKMAKTAYGQEIKSVPISALKLIFAGMFIIVGIFQLTVIY